MTGLEIALLTAVVLATGTWLLARGRPRSIYLSETGEWSVWGLIVGLVVFAVVLGVAFWLIDILRTEQKGVGAITKECNIAKLKTNSTLPAVCTEIIK